ncbi:hypothetical protein [Azospirillum sp. sgz301742]
MIKPTAEQFDVLVRAAEWYAARSGEHAARIQDLLWTGRIVDCLSDEDAGWAAIGVLASYVVLSGRDDVEVARSLLREFFQVLRPSLGLTGNRQRENL